MTVRSRWLEIAATLRDGLPGRWSLRGGGQKTMIVGEPIEWAIPWFGFSKGSVGRLHCGVAPAIEPLLAWRMGRYGFDMSEVRGGPRSIDMLADDALDIARGFVFGPGLERIGLLTPEYYAERAEQEAADPEPEDGWVLMAPGSHVINDSGSPVEVGEAVHRVGAAALRPRSGIRRPARRLLPPTHRCLERQWSRCGTVVPGRSPRSATPRAEAGRAALTTPGSRCCRASASSETGS